jgi:ABC-type transporter Mla subunit MlaD
MDRLTKDSLHAIETKGLAFTREMLSNSSEIAGIINDASTSASSALNRTLEDIHKNAKASVDQSRQTAAAAVAEVMETHALLRRDTTEVFERLRDANVLLQEVLSGATENLGKIEGSLSARVREFVATVTQVSERGSQTSAKMEEHIKAFHGTTTAVLRDIATAAAQFDQHGRALAAAAEAIDVGNGRTAEALTERRTALEGLIAELDGKSEDLDQRLVRFAKLLTDSLEAAESRTREVARIIAESSSSGSQAIAAQYDMVRATAEDERKRTADTLNSIYEQAAGDIHALFAQAAERFSGIVRDMREMAGQVQQELDMTRAEMRRGVLELPQEAAESTAQMRRVIVEQIDALAELNRIVARHGRGIDTAEPGRRPREEPVPVPAAAAPARPAPREPAGARPPPPGFAPPLQRSDGPPPGNDRRGGWLTDVLARASRDEGPSARGDERPARHSIESLDSLSVDIARMIDHDAATELWDRYKRGERNVFTKRLYTMQGQRTFEEIRKRYRADREFKQTVDRYIAEFERLLDDVSQDDRGAVVARTYLTSETGKVYTMLAHAAGRFE